MSATLCPVCEVSLAIQSRHTHKLRCGKCRSRLEVSWVDGKHYLKELDEEPEPKENPRSCRKCGCDDSKVIRTTPPPKDGTTVKRRRECRNCGHRWTTKEGRMSS